MASIAQIKAGLGIPTLNLQRSLKDGAPTEWLRHWENDSRIAISIHQDTLAYAKEHPTAECYIAQREERFSEASNQPYTSFRIVKVNAEIEATL